MLRIISYNIRYNNPGDGENAWPYRKERVAELLRHHQPDLIGLQEVKKDQLDDLIPRLPDFDWVGVGRDDGQSEGEFAPIFYRRTRLELVASGTFWLSETPNVVASVGWDASLTRIATWAQLLDTQSGTQLLHLNTHFDHRGMNSQVESAYLLRRFLAEQTAPLPTVVTGDFNCTPLSLPYQALTTPDEHATPPLLDAIQIARSPHEGPLATFNGTFTEPLQDKIDYIFIGQPAGERVEEPMGKIEVLRHAILADNQGGRYPSDHLPVLVELVAKR